MLITLTDTVPIRKADHLVKFRTTERHAKITLIDEQIIDVYAALDNLPVNTSHQTSCQLSTHKHERNKPGVSLATT